MARIAQSSIDVGPDVRVLVGMRGVDVEEAAAVGAELLDGDLAGDRALRDRLLGAFERRRIDVGAEVLRHAERDERERHDDRQRQQHVERGAREIDPEIADRRRPWRGRRRAPAARRSAMPVAAETKFCTVSPTIWLK